jgi:hypothetical protein
MTSEEYQALIARQAHAAGVLKPDLPPPKPAKPVRESALHKLILAECHRRNLLAFHGSTAHRTHRTEGEPDFVILLPGGRVLLIECKTATGQLSDAQVDVTARAALLGHRVYLVRCFEDFHNTLLFNLLKTSAYENPTKT